MAVGRNWWTVVGLLSLLVAVATGDQQVEGEGFKFTKPEYTLHVANNELCGDGVSFEITGDKCSVWVLPENGTGKRKYRFCIDTSKLFNQMMATTAGFPSDGVDFGIVQEVIPCKRLDEQGSPHPVQISFPPTSKEGLWDFSLRLVCYVLQEPCGTAEVNVTVHSSSGWIGFQFPIFHGFARDFLQIWLVKNGSMPVNVSVVLAREEEESSGQNTLQPLHEDTLKNATFNILNGGTFNATLEILSDSCIEVGQPAQVEVLEPLSDPRFQHLINDLENKIDKLQARLEDQEIKYQARLEDQETTHQRQMASLEEQIEEHLKLELLNDLLNAIAPSGVLTVTTEESTPASSTSSTSSGSSSTSSGSSSTSSGASSTSPGASSTFSGSLSTTSASASPSPIPTGPGITVEDGGGATAEGPTGDSGMNWQLALVAIVGLLVVAVAGYVGYYNRKKLYDWVTGRGGGGGGGGGRGGRRKHYRRLPQSVHDAMVHND